MRKAIEFLTTSCAALLVLATTLAAQQRVTLDDVETQMRSNQYAQARATLQKWQTAQTQKPSAGEDESWRAAYLDARLAVDLKDAEDGWLSIAIAAPPSNRYKAEALLRVGQAELTQGHTRDAISYLKRVVDNYPRSEFAPVAADWLQRAQSQKPPEPSVGAPPTSAGAWTVQVAAFREQNGARSVARQLQKQGFSDVRIATVPENTLLRVRVGHFKSAAAAADVIAKLRQAGFSAVVTSDAARETRAHE